MKRTLIERDMIKIVGLKVRTQNDQEMNPETSKISALVNDYFSKARSTHIKHRVKPNITYSIYTEYESNETGEYSYYIGEEVSQFVEQDLAFFSCLTIPKQYYQAFTTPKGTMPGIIIDAWQAIWVMNEKDIGGKRSYLADFEIFDERSHNPSKAEVDIYVGVARPSFI